MNDAIIMRMLERIGSLAYQLHHIPSCKQSTIFALPQLVCKRAFGAERHHHIGRSAAICVGLVKIEERQNVRVIEFSNGLCLAAEEPHSVSACFVVWIGIDIPLNDFNGYLAVNAHILSQVDLAHSSLPNEPEQAISSILQLFKAIFFPMNTI